MLANFSTIPTPVAGIPSGYEYATGRVSGSRSVQSLIGSYNELWYGEPLGNPYSRVVFGCAVNVPSSIRKGETSGGGHGFGFLFWHNESIYSLIGYHPRHNWYISVYGYRERLVETDYPVDGWHYYDMLWDAGASKIEMYVDDRLLFSKTVQNMPNVMLCGVFYKRLNSNTQKLKACDMYLIAGTSGKYVNPIGDCIAFRSMLNGDSVTEFSRSDGSSNFSCVNDYETMDLKYVYTANAGKKDLYTAGSVSSPYNVIAVKQESMGSEVKNCIKVGEGSIYSGSESSLLTVWETQPGGSSDWTTSAYNNTKFGVISI